MFFSYMVSVVLLSLAMYGLGCLFHDLWKWRLRPGTAFEGEFGFLILPGKEVQQLEELLRYLAQEMEREAVEGTLVVLLEDSSFLMQQMLRRVLLTMPELKVLEGGNLRDGMALCRGQVIHVLDLGRRLPGEEGKAAAARILGR